MAGGKLYLPHGRAPAPPTTTRSRPRPKRWPSSRRGATKRRAPPTRRSASGRAPVIAAKAWGPGATRGGHAGRSIFSLDADSRRTGAKHRGRASPRPRGSRGTAEPSRLGSRRATGSSGFRRCGHRSVPLRRCDHADRSSGRAMDRRGARSLPSGMAVATRPSSRLQVARTRHAALRSAGDRDGRPRRRAAWRPAARRPSTSSSMREPRPLRWSSSRTASRKRDARLPGHNPIAVETWPRSAPTHPYPPSFDPLGGNGEAALRLTVDLEGRSVTRFWTSRNRCSFFPNFRCASIPRR